MLSLLCSLNVYKTSTTTVTQTTVTKGSRLKRKKRKKKEIKTHWKREKSGELTPSLPSRLRELQSIAVTHGAEEDHCQCHQSQLHSPCCLPGLAGSPPATRWIRWGGPLPLWDRWIPLLLGQMIPPLCSGTALFLCLSLPSPPPPSVFLYLSL